MFEEHPAHLRRKKYHACEEHQEHDDPYKILRRVVRVERHAVERYAIRSLVFLDLDAIRIV